jgi:hypothetical protein
MAALQVKEFWIRGKHYKPMEGTFKRNLDIVNVTNNGAAVADVSKQVLENFRKILLKHGKSIQNIQERNK